MYDCSPRHPYAGTVALAVFGIFLVTMLMHLTQYETTVSDREIVIQRPGIVPGSKTTYAVNLETGDELIEVFNPLGDTWFIDYDGNCECVTSVHKVGEYSVSFILYHKNKERYVFYREGKTIAEVVPFEKHLGKFHEAAEVRGGLRARFADILPTAP